MKDTIDMAREAGLPFGERGAIPLWDKELERFAALVRANEREACAKVCDDIDDSHWGCEVKASWCSREIRARGETK